MKQKQHHRIVILLACMMSLLVGISSGNTLADEVYKWTDANGIVHYGDKPPEGQDAQTVNIRETKPPGTTQSDTRPQTVTIADDSGGQESPPAQSFAQARREKLANDRKEQRAAQAELDAMCELHRKSLADIEPNRRVFYKGENGDTVRMDDEQRISLVNESKDFIAKNCE